MSCFSGKGCSEFPKKVYYLNGILIEDYRISNKGEYLYIDTATEKLLAYKENYTKM